MRHTTHLSRALRQRRLAEARRIGTDLILEVHNPDPLDVPGFLIDEQSVADGVLWILQIPKELLSDPATKESILALPRVAKITVDIPAGINDFHSEGHVTVCA